MQLSSTYGSALAGLPTCAGQIAGKDSARSSRQWPHARLAGRSRRAASSASGRRLAQRSAPRRLKPSRRSTQSYRQPASSPSLSPSRALPLLCEAATASRRHGRSRVPWAPDRLLELTGDYCGLAHFDRHRPSGRGPPGGSPIPPAACEIFEEAGYSATSPLTHRMPGLVTVRARPPRGLCRRRDRHGDLGDERDVATQSSRRLVLARCYTPGAASTKRRRCSHAGVCASTTRRTTVRAGPRRSRRPRRCPRRGCTEEAIESSKRALLLSARVLGWVAQVKPSSTCCGIHLRLSLAHAVYVPAGTFSRMDETEYILDRLPAHRVPAAERAPDETLLSEVPGRRPPRPRPGFAPRAARPQRLERAVEHLAGSGREDGGWRRKEILAA